MQRLEDHDLTNSFTALGPVKPGLFRRWLTQMILYAIDYACRHVFGRGHLARVQTIHFARWVFLDGKTRVLFASNYDGSHESYMDDFINKVGLGPEPDLQQRLRLATHRLAAEGRGAARVALQVLPADGTSCRPRSGTRPTPA